MTRLRRQPLLLLGALLLVTATPVAMGHGHPTDGDMHGMSMVGNMDPYPDLEHARPRDVRRARRLVRASKASAYRFDTMAEARRLGYRVRRFIRPGFTHMRKNGSSFWGRLLDEKTPQSLVFWCPSAGRCTLAAYMYRAPAGDPPSTWGDILQWHRHAGSSAATWATHVWLVGHTREGLATCAPMKALSEMLGIVVEPYVSTPLDRPCPEAAR